MSAKQRKEPQAAQAAKPKVKLTNAEKREIRRIIETARGDGKVHSAQDTLPFRQMYPDGLCRLDEKTRGEGNGARAVPFNYKKYKKLLAVSIIQN